MQITISHILEIFTTLENQNSIYTNKISRIKNFCQTISKLDFNWNLYIKFLRFINKTMLCIVEKVLLTALCHSPGATTKSNSCYLIIPMRIIYFQLVQPVQVITTNIQGFFKFSFFKVLLVPVKIKLQYCSKENVDNK